jgi:hypothetical protein
MFLPFQLLWCGLGRKWLFGPMAVEISRDLMYNFNEKWENKVLLYDINNKCVFNAHLMPNCCKKYNAERHFLTQCIKAALNIS